MGKSKSDGEAFRDAHRAAAQAEAREKDSRKAAEAGRAAYDKAVKKHFGNRSR